MNRQIFAALMTLATASGAMPGLVAEVQAAVAQGQRLSQDGILRSVYGVALSANGRATGAKAFQAYGYNATEASQMADVAVALASKAGSADRFLAMIKGTNPAGVTLTPREMAMLTSVSAKSRSGGGLRSTGTWEGSSNGTWEGSALTARPVTSGPVTLAPNAVGGAKVVGPTTGTGPAVQKGAAGGR